MNKKVLLFFVGGLVGILILIMFSLCASSLWSSNRDSWGNTNSKGLINSNEPITNQTKITNNSKTDYLSDEEMKILAYYYEGIKHLKEKDYEKSIKILNTALSIPTNRNFLKAYCYSGLSANYNNLGNKDEAIKNINKAIEFYPNEKEFQEIKNIILGFSNKSNYKKINQTTNNYQISQNIDYILPESNSRLINIEEISSLNNWELKVARNEIYARHGRKFKSNDLKCYFQSKNWYAENPNYSDSLLNQFEGNNIKKIYEYEKKQQDNLMSTDLGCNLQNITISETRNNKTLSTPNNNKLKETVTPHFPFKGKSKNEIMTLFSSWEPRVNYNVQYKHSIKFRKNYDLVINFDNTGACGFSIYDLPGEYGVGISESDLNNFIIMFAGHTNVSKDIERDENGTIREAYIGKIIDE